MRPTSLTSSLNTPTDNFQLPKQNHKPTIALLSCSPSYSNGHSSPSPSFFKISKSNANPNSQYLSFSHNLFQFQRIPAYTSDLSSLLSRLGISSLPLSCNSSAPASSPLFSLPDWSLNIREVSSFPLSHFSCRWQSKSPSRRLRFWLLSASPIDLASGVDACSKSPVAGERQPPSISVSLSSRSLAQ